MLDQKLGHWVKSKKKVAYQLEATILIKIPWNLLIYL